MKKRFNRSSDTTLFKKTKPEKYGGTFLLDTPNLDYFILSLENKRNTSSADSKLLRFMLTNYAYNNNFTKYQNPKNGKIYKPEKFQLLFTIADYTLLGGSKQIFYRTMRKLKDLKIIERRNILPINVKRDFVNVNECWKLYNLFVQEDTANALWLEDSHSFQVNTISKLCSTIRFKEKHKSKKTNIVPFTKTYEDEIPTNLTEADSPWGSTSDLEVNHG